MLCAAAALHVLTPRLAAFTVYSLQSERADGVDRPIMSMFPSMSGRVPLCFSLPL